MENVIYLAGGCFWGIEKYVSSIRGVVDTEVGYANGHTEHPTYEEVRYEQTGHAETVKVTFDPDEITLPVLLELFYRIIDPTSVDRQGHDEGHQYRTGIYTTDPAMLPVIRESLARLQTRWTAPLVVEAGPLEQFFPAETYHQDYLDKNPGGYCHVPFSEIAWVSTVDPKTWSPDCPQE